jgi:transketolase
MGISKAKGMALANRLAGTMRRIFVLTGDGELQEGQFWESLGSAANMGLGEIVAIIDHNKIQSDTWVRKVSDLGDLEAKLIAFGWHVSRCDGHDVRALERTFRGLDAVVDRPKVIIADTVQRSWCLVHGRPRGAAGERPVPVSFGAPPEQQYLDGLRELLATAERACAGLALGALKTETRTRNPRREPRDTQNLVAAYGRRSCSRPIAIPIWSCSTPT